MNRSTVLLVALVLAAFGHAADSSEAIVRAANNYVKKETAVKDPLVTVQKVADGYARVRVKSKSGATDPEKLKELKFSAAVIARDGASRLKSPVLAWPQQKSKPSSSLIIE